MQWAEEREAKETEGTIRKLEEPWERVAAPQRLRGRFTGTGWSAE